MAVLGLSFIADRGGGVGKRTLLIIGSKLQHRRRMLRGLPGPPCLRSDNANQAFYISEWESSRTWWRPRHGSRYWLEVGGDFILAKEPPLRASLFSIIKLYQSHCECIPNSPMTSWSFQWPVWYVCSRQLAVVGPQKNMFLGRPVVPIPRYYVLIVPNQFSTIKDDNHRGDKGSRLLPWRWGQKKKSVRFVRPKST